MALWKASQALSAKGSEGRVAYLVLLKNKHSTNKPNHSTTYKNILHLSCGVFWHLELCLDSCLFRRWIKYFDSKQVSKSLLTAVGFEIFTVGTKKVEKEIKLHFQFLLFLFDHVSLTEKWINTSVGVFDLPPDPFSKGLFSWFFYVRMRSTRASLVAALPSSHSEENKN